MVNIRRSFKSMLCLLGSTAIFAASMNVAQAASTLRVYSSLPADANSAHYVWFERFKKNVDTRLKGELKVNYFPNAMLGKEADAVQQVRMGAIDMMISGSSIWATLVPEVGVLDLGYLFNSYAHVGKALDGAPGKMLSDIMEKKANVKVLGYGYSFGVRNVYTRQQVKTPQDLQKLKIRVLPVPNFIATLKSMGTVPIPMPGGEVYSGLQMGVIDGLEHDAATVLASKFYEKAKYATLTQHIYNPVVVTINKNSFNRLPENVRKEVLAAAADATKFERQAAAATEAKAFATLKSRGLVVTTIDKTAFEKAVKPVWADFSKKYPSTAPILKAIEASK